MHLQPIHDEGGPAGDTGSAVHAAAAAYHRGKGEAESLAEMGAGLAKYPLANLADAADMFLKYAADPRNRGIKVLLVEHPVAFTLEPAPEDKTRQKIAVVGTVDQVREHDDGRIRAWDIKTSKKPPGEILNDTVYQLACYCVGASVFLRKRVDPGGIICPRQYQKATPSNAHFSYPWTFDDIEDILEAVRHAVAAVRNGNLHHLPNAGCYWCHHKTPDFCLPKLREYRRAARLEPTVFVPRHTGIDPREDSCVQCLTVTTTTIEETADGVLRRLCATCLEATRG